ncbi:hypothetical protein SAY86_012849 [Trapa natans]|uniref:ZF-HD dimerization-type domain-containing protein n=1 Tax=Trapa natans TaxID=22666 RepID=A0AAN7RB19_TRANT|nr:hypothetical protein SAY86_012849 [Trapa natans]
MKKRQVVVRRSDGLRRSTSNTSSSAIRVVRYGECQKNHAASIGGYAVDGCREFMASGEEGTEDALNCAACGCHRNFHQRELDIAEVALLSAPQWNHTVFLSMLNLLDHIVSAMDFTGRSLFALKIDSAKDSDRGHKLVFIPEFDRPFFYSIVDHGKLILEDLCFP